MTKKPTTNFRLSRLEARKVSYRAFGVVIILLVLWTFYVLAGDALQVKQLEHRVEALEANLTEMQSWFEWECIENETIQLQRVRLTSPTMACGEGFRCRQEGEWKTERGEIYNSTVCRREKLKVKEVTREVSYPL